MLVPIAVVLGAGEGLFLPASLAVIPRLLPEADLQAGNALGSAGTQLATLVGPAVGGVVVALAGPAVAFVADGASFVVSAVSLADVRRAQRAVAAVAPDASRDAVAPDAPAARAQPGGAGPFPSPAVRPRRRCAAPASTPCRRRCAAAARSRP
ncbi:MAG TPA: MFS transporter, partial [Acidimicrobiales bacterium]|nr:MFS transporter [Acidimicrobiales bacterium]